MLKLAVGITAGIAIVGGVAAYALTLPEAAPTAGASEGSTGQAAEVLNRSAEAYARAAGFTDTMRLEISLPDGGEEIVRVPYAFGAGTDSWVGMPTLEATALGKSLYLVREDINDKYAELTLTGNMGTTLDAIFGGDANLPVAFDMRARRGTERYVAALGLGVLDRPQLSGYEEMSDGAHRLSLTAKNGTAEARIDGKTLLLKTLDVKAASIDDPASVLMAHVTFTPKVHDSPADLIKFDPGRRRKVSSFRELQPTPVAVGQTAPDFTLKTLEGETVTLSDLRGSVVVIDFWATWCGPCILGLPLLDEFNDWAKESGKPIAVYAIDTFENGPADRVAQQAASFWKSKKFSMPTLLDIGNAAVSRFGIQSIPTTYIIDREGVIVKIHSGFDPKMASKLQREVLEILGDT